MGILISLLVAVIVVAIICWIVTLLPLPPPFNKIAMAICALILLFWVLGIVGILPGGAWIIRAP